MGVVRRLDDDPVAGREHLDQRPDRQVEGEVPGDDVPDNALGLVTDSGGAGAVERTVDVPLVIGHPGGQLLDGVHRPTGDTEHFDEVAEQLGVDGEVLAHGPSDAVAVAHDHPSQRTQVLGPLLQRRVGVDEKGSALDGVQPMQLGDRSGVVEGGGRGRYEHRHGLNLASGVTGVSQDVRGTRPSR